MPNPHPYYLVWSGALNLGDTPGVFTNAHFVGLLLQIPLEVTYLTDDTEPLGLLLMTTEVEIFNGKKHPVYWNWEPGTPLPTPIGFIDDVDLIPGRPEYHPLSIPRDAVGVGKHSMTIQVNSEVGAGLRDDFVLRQIEAHDSAGVKIGW